MRTFFALLIVCATLFTACNNDESSNVAPDPGSLNLVFEKLENINSILLI